MKNFLLKINELTSDSFKLTVSLQISGVSQNQDLLYVIQKLLVYLFFNVSVSFSFFLFPTVCFFDDFFATIFFDGRILIYW